MTPKSDRIDETIKKTYVAKSPDALHESGKFITFRPRNAWLPLSMKRILLS